MIGFTVDRRNDVLAAVTLRDSLTNSNTYVTFVAQLCSHSYLNSFSQSNGRRQFELKFYARQLSTGQAQVRRDPVP